MRIQNFSFLASICVGLFLALNFYMYFFFYKTPEFKWISVSYQIKTYLETAALFFTIGLVISIFFSIVIGWPLYLIAKKFHMVNHITSASGGAAVTIIPLILCIKFGWNIPSLRTSSGQLVFLVLMFCGAVSGIIFNILQSKSA